MANSTNRPLILLCAILGAVSTTSLYFNFKQRSGTNNDDSALQSEPSRPVEVKQQIEERQNEPTKMVPKLPELGHEKPHNYGELSQELLAVLGQLKQLSESFTGSELSQARMGFLSEVSAKRTLSLEDSLQLCSELFYIISDDDLRTAWGILLPNSVGRRDFSVAATIDYFPAGTLAADFLRRLGNDLAVMGREMTDEDISALRMTYSAAEVEGLIVANGQAHNRRNPSKALDLLLKHETNLTDLGIASILGGLGSESHFQQYEKRIITDGSEQASGNGVIRSFAGGLASVNPTSAARWVEQIKDPETKGLAAESLMVQWMSNDPMSAGKWLASTNLEGMDPAISALATELARYSPNDARRWATAITDEGRKSQTLEYIDSLHPPAEQR